MTESYEFDRTADRIVARPVADPDRRIELDAAWLETDGVGGRWERIVRTLLREVPDAIDFESGEGTLERERALGALAAEQSDIEALAGKRERADALLELLAAEGHILVEDDDVLVLPGPDRARDRENGARLCLHWAVALEVCLEWTDRIMDGLYRAKPDAAEQTADDTVDSARIVDQLECVESLRTALRNRSEEFRTAALKAKTFPEDVTIGHRTNGPPIVKQLLDEFVRFERQSDETSSPTAAVEFVENTASLSTQLAGVVGIEEELESVSDEELEGLVDEALSDIESVGESVAEGAGDADSADDVDGTDDLQL